MIYPTLSPLRLREDTVETFLGYRRVPRPGVGEFYDMQNLSAAAFPQLGTRPPRSAVTAETEPGGILWKNGLVRVEGGTLYLADYPALTGLTPGRKQLVSMGANILVFPDKVYLNTLDLTDSGPMEAVLTLETAAIFTPATADGVSLPTAPRQASPPENPFGGEYWVDTSGESPVWKVYSGDAGLWTALADTCVKIAAPGIAAPFRPGDGVTLNGIDPNLGDLAPWEGAALVLIDLHHDEAGEGVGDWVLFRGVLPGEILQERPGLTLARRLPEMDFVIEGGNRLWGCRYGLNAAGEPVNEIYASKLGDFRNFQVYQGLSTDSYAAGLGSDGPFTGAVTYLGMPTFFKEGVIHTVWGSLPENFRIQTVAAPGVAKGSEASPATVGGILYYLSPAGVMRYDGSLPEAVGKDLGEGDLTQGVGGDGGERYYLSALDGEENPHLLVYDPQKALWHREDDLRVTAFAPGEGRLFAETAEGILLLLGGDGTEEFDWMAQTGPLYAKHPEKERLTLVTLRLKLDPQGEARFLVRYDGTGEFREVAALRGGGLAARRVLIRPRACDFLELRMEGRGAMRLYSLSRRMEEVGR